MLNPQAQASNRHTVSIEFMIFVIPALAGSQVCEIVDELYGFDPFDHLEAQLILASQSKRGSVQHAKRRSVQLIGKQGQLVPHVLNLVNIIVTAAVGPIGK